MGLRTHLTATAGPQFTKRYEAVRGFVPQGQPHAAQAFLESDAADSCKFGMDPKRVRQPIKRNSAAQMMHVMHPNIGGEPARDSGKVVIRAPAERRFAQVPIVVMGPECVGD